MINYKEMSKEDKNKNKKGPDRERNGESCPLCDVSKETIRELKMAAKNKKEKK